MEIKHMRVLLIDDEIDSQEITSLMLKKGCPQVEIVGKCSTANEAIEEIQRLKPDLILLDIEMPGKDGFEVLKAFENPDFKVIIVTGYEQYALTAIKFSAIDYVLKPIDYNDLLIAINKVESTMKREDGRISHFNSLQREQNKPFEKLVIPTLKGFHTIALTDIVSIESKSGNYCLFKLTNGDLDLVTKPLSYFEELLPKANYFRVHRSHLVNFSSVSQYDAKKGIVILEDGEEIEVAIRRRGDFRRAFREFIA